MQSDAHWEKQPQLQTHNIQLYISWFSFESISTFPYNTEKSQFPDTGDLEARSITG